MVKKYKSLDQKWPTREEDIRTAQHFLEQLSTQGESIKSFSLSHLVL